MVARSNNKMREIGSAPLAGFHMSPGKIGKLAKLTTNRKICK